MAKRTPPSQSKGATKVSATAIPVSLEKGKLSRDGSYSIFPAQFYSQVSDANAVGSGACTGTGKRSPL